MYVKRFTYTKCRYYKIGTAVPGTGIEFYIMIDPVAVVLPSRFKMRAVLLVVLASIGGALVSAGNGAAPLSRIKVDRDTQFFVDDDGRARFFHGVNAVEKLPPFHPVLEGFDPVRSLSVEDAARLSGWGFNVRFVLYVDSQKGRAAYSSPMTLLP